LLLRQPFFRQGCWICPNGFRDVGGLPALLNFLERGKQKGPGVLPGPFLFLVSFLVEP